MPQRLVARTHSLRLEVFGTVAPATAQLGAALPRPPPHATARSPSVRGRRCPRWSRRCGCTVFGAGRSSPPPPDGRAAPGLAACSGRSADDGVVVPTELAGPPESVLGALPRTGVTCGYMNWCVIWSLWKRAFVRDPRTGPAGPPEPVVGTQCPLMRQLYLNPRRRKPRVLPPATLRSVRRPRRPGPAMSSETSAQTEQRVQPHPGQNAGIVSPASRPRRLRAGSWARRWRRLARRGAERALLGDRACRRGGGRGGSGRWCD
jgi:hypothetical protein